MAEIRKRSSRPEGDALEPTVPENFPVAARLPSRIWIAVTIFRLFNALSIATFFQPDEFWQSLEVAHRAVFGYGYLTWEWRERIRSFAYPAVYALLFEILKLFGLDSVGNSPVVASKLFGGLVAAANDYFTYRLAFRLYNPRTAKWALICSISSWFIYFCMTRALSNTMETVFTVAALALWPWPHLRRLEGNVVPWMQFTVSLFIAAFGCLLRPTAAVTWVLPGMHLFFASPAQDRAKLIGLTGFVGAIATGSGLLIDRVFYGTWTVTAANFYQINVSQNISSFYGSHPWHWYLSQGWPVLLGPFVVLALARAARSSDANASSRILLSILAWTTAVYSLLGHKEFRFLLPMLPLGLVLLAGELRRLFTRSRPIAVSFIILNAVFAYYACQIHQRGVVDVTSYIRDGARDGTIKDAFFLMPCHSTPFHSHVHAGPDFRMEFLTCEPPLGVEDRQSYVDEADRFYGDPVRFVTDRFSGVNLTWHTMLLFEAAQPRLEPWLRSRGFVPVARFFNSHFHDDARRRGDVLVYSRP